MCPRRRRGAPRGALAPPPTASTTTSTPSSLEARVAQLEAKLGTVSSAQASTAADVAALRTTVDAHVASSTAAYERLFALLDQRLPDAEGAPRAAKAPRQRGTG